MHEKQRSLRPSASTHPLASSRAVFGTQRAVPCFKTAIGDNPRQGNLGLAKGLAILDLLQAVLLEPDGLDGDKAARVHGREALEGVHGRVLLGVQVRRVARSAEDVGLVEREG